MSSFGRIAALCVTAWLVATGSVARSAEPDAVARRLHVGAEQRAAFDAIERLNRQWIDAYTRGDLERFMACYTDDAMLALAGGRALTGKDAIRAFFAPRLKDVSARRVDVVFRYEKFSIERDLAYLVTLNWITLDSVTPGSPGHSPARTGARSILVYRRVPGRGWLMDVDIEQRTLDADVAELPGSDLKAGR